MLRQNQIVAIEKGQKNQTAQALTAIYHQVQKGDLFFGISRSYRPKDDEGDQLPPESKKLQVTAEKSLRDFGEALTKLLDITATKDWGNRTTGSDVVLDGKVLIENAPVPFLLMLEKKLVDLHTFIKSLPTLDPAETWQYDEGQACYASSPTETTKTKKVLRNHVKAEATDRHPAQVDTYSEDIVVGYWKTIKFSGAIPTKRAAELLERTEKLQQAVKFAREQANMEEILLQQVGKKIFEYVIG